MIVFEFTDRAYRGIKLVSDRRSNVECLFFLFDSCPFLSPNILYSTDDVRRAVFKMQFDGGFRSFDLFEVKTQQ